MRAFFYQVRALAGIEQTYLLERVGSDGNRQVLPYAQDDVNWLALLSRSLPGISGQLFGSAGITQKQGWDSSGWQDLLECVS